VVSEDGVINPTGNLAAVAYSNNFAGASSTVLYGIESSGDRLVIQNPPNEGALAPIGALGVDTTEISGFDIAGTGNSAYAALTAPAAMSSSLYTINLATGLATLVGPIDSNNPVQGLALVTGVETVFGVTVNNVLVRFNSHAPATLLTASPITGLQAGENMLGIDFRPATGELYGLGSSSRIYRIDTVSGAATQVGAGTLTTPLNGTDFGIDFNPTVDRLRVVSDAEQSLAINPDTAAVSVSAALNPAANVVAAAYLNNFAGATSTTLYDLDSTTDLLLTQVPATGALSAVGPLGVDASGLTGLDIAPGGIAFASITPPAGATTDFYTVNLATGAATRIGTIGGGQVMRDTAIAISNTETVYGLTQLAGPTHNLIRFNAATPNIIISTVAITGLQAGESLLGIDSRPANGQLFGLGSTSRLYQVNSSTGVASQVGTGTLTTLLSGSAFGFDFNPTVDRVRVVSNAEQNIAINPITAAVTVNGALNPAGNVAAAAYSNNFSGATSTTLYDIDSTASTLATQVPATGALTLVGNLGIAISNGNVGFDIASLSGHAYLSAYTGGASPALYRVNLGSGTATLVGTINVVDTLVDVTLRIATVAPSVTTLPATLVAGTSATLNGTANPAGDATTGWFRYDTTDPGSCNDTFGTRAPASGGAALGSGAASTPYSEPVAGLAPSTTYYFCALAANGAGTAFGAVQTFTTVAVGTQVFRDGFEQP
jgi:hypothetical protein